MNITYSAGALIFCVYRMAFHQRSVIRLCFSVIDSQFQILPEYKNIPVLFINNMAVSEILKGIYIINIINGVHKYKLKPNI